MKRKDLNIWDTYYFKNTYMVKWRLKLSNEDIIARDEKNNIGKANWLFNVTINDISVIYVTAHRCAGGLKKKLDLRSGSQRHRHFVGFFNVPVLAPTRGPTFLYGDSDTPPHLVAFYDHAGDTEVHILDPPGPHGKKKTQTSFLFYNLGNISKSVDNCGLSIIVQSALLIHFKQKI